MHVTTSAIVLHVIRYGEADLIAKLLTKSSGRRSYLLRGVRKSKKGKIKVSLFQPLTLLEIEAVHKDKGTLEHIREARLGQPYSTLHTDFTKSSLVLFLSEVLNNAIQEEEQNLGLYAYIETALLWLDDHKDIANFHLTFLINLTKYLGFYPDVTASSATYFNLEEGCFQEENANPYCITGRAVVMLPLFLGTTFEACAMIKMTKIVRGQMLSLVLTYFELHLQGFKKPKSLSILNEIYN